MSLLGPRASVRLAAVASFILCLVLHANGRLLVVEEVPNQVGALYVTVGGNGAVAAGDEPQHFLRTSYFFSPAFSSPLAWLQQQLMLAEAMQRAALQSFQQQLAASLLYPRYSQYSAGDESQQELLRRVGCARMRAALIGQSGTGAAQGMATTPLLTARTDMGIGAAAADADASSTAADSADSTAAATTGAALPSQQQDAAYEYFEDYAKGSVVSRAVYARSSGSGRSSAVTGGDAAADATSVAAAAVDGTRNADGVASSSSSASGAAAEGHIVKLLEDDSYTLAYSDDDAVALETLAHARASLAAAAAAASTTRAASAAAAVAAAAAAAAGGAAASLGGSVVAANARPAVTAGGLPDPEAEIADAYESGSAGLLRAGEQAEGPDGDDMGYSEDGEDEEQHAEDNIFDLVLGYNAMNEEDDDFWDEWADYLELSYTLESLVLNGDYYLDYPDEYPNDYAFDAYDGYDEYDMVYRQYADGGFAAMATAGGLARSEASALEAMSRLAQLVAWARLAGGAGGASAFALPSGLEGGDADAGADTYGDGSDAGDDLATATLYVFPAGDGDAGARLATVFNIGGPYDPRVGPDGAVQADGAEEDGQAWSGAGLQLVNDLDLHWVRPDGTVNWGLVTLAFLAAGVAAVAAGAVAAALSLRATVRRARWVYVPPPRCGGKGGNGAVGCGYGTGAGWGKEGYEGGLGAPLLLRPEECYGASPVPAPAAVVSAAEYVPPALRNESVARALAK